MFQAPIRSDSFANCINKDKYHTEYLSGFCTQKKRNEDDFDDTIIEVSLSVCMSVTKVHNMNRNKQTAKINTLCKHTINTLCKHNVLILADCVN